MAKSSSMQWKMIFATNILPNGPKPPSPQRFGSLTRHVPMTRLCRSRWAISFTLPSIFLSSRKAQKTFRKARLVLHQHLILLLVLQTSRARHMDPRAGGQVSISGGARCTVKDSCGSDGPKTAPDLALLQQRTPEVHFEAVLLQVLSASIRFNPLRSCRAMRRHPAERKGLHRAQ